jgi:type IV pilus assembly protein PilF
MKSRKLVSMLLSCCVLLLSACTSSRFVSSMDDEKVAIDKPDVQRRVSIRMQLAVDYFTQGQPKLALEEVRNVINLSPNFADAYNLRGLIQMEMKDMPRAEENFLHALKLDPSNSDITNNYAWFLCENGRGKQALPLFDKILSDRTYATPLKTMLSAGVCSLRLKDVATAERYFKLGADLQPNNPSVNANLAKLYYDKGKLDDARIYIQRVLREEIFAADVLWLAIKIDNKLGDRASVNGLATQLRRRHPNSKEFASFQKGAFNE